MKRCPECRQEYFDDSLNFCLEDGARLVGEHTSGESRTEILPVSGAVDPLEQETKYLDRERAEQTRPSSRPAGEFRKPRTIVLLGVAIAVCLIGAAAFAAYKFLNAAETADAFQNFQPHRITTSGRAVEANISPDGKYVVYLDMSDDGHRTLSIRQTATGDTIPIVPSTRGNILKGTTFSPDGNFVYYLFSDRTKGTSLHQVSSLGGTPKKVLEVCEGPVAFSPDGKKIAFTRNEGELDSQINIANSDGTNEQPLASLPVPDWFTESGPSWSPDGRTIAITAGQLTQDGVMRFRLLAIDVGSGSVTEISDQRWAGAGRVVWLPDGISLILMAAESPDEPGVQAWRITYPSGEAVRITNDVYGYDDTSLGVTADGRTLLVVTKQTFSRLESIPVTGDTSSPLKLSQTDSTQDGFVGFDVLKDGGIVFSSFQDGRSDLWSMNADGTGRRRLTSDPYWEGDPAASPDGRYIVFRSNRPDGQMLSRLWRMDADGGNVVQLAPRADSSISFSHDGGSVIFSAWHDEDKSFALWSVGIGGGEPVRLTHIPFNQPAYSPDGQQISGYFLDAREGRWRYGILPAAGGEPVAQFDFPGFQYEWVRWTPDGKHLSHIGAPPDPSNIWLQPTEGGESKKLTDFKTDYIFRHAWSRDGKTLLMARGRPAFDVVLLKDER